MTLQVNCATVFQPFKSEGLFRKDFLDSHYVQQLALYGWARVYQLTCSTVFARARWICWNDWVSLTPSA